MDADALIYSIVTNGTKGTATLTDFNTGTYTYTPTPNQNGTDTFTFQVNDSTVNSTPATITITIIPAPPPPPVTPPPPPPAPVTTTPEPPPPLPPMTLTVSVSGTGTGGLTSTSAGLDCSPTSALCTYTVTTPTWVTLTATPAEGSQLSQWGGDAACQSDGKVLILADTTCQATFELQSYELTVGRFGDGHVTGPDIECPPDCTETFLYGTEVQLEAKAGREWIHTGWQGSCDQTGKVTVTQAHLCQAVFQEDPNVPNQLDGNGDGIPDARQPNVISLPDKVVGNYVSFEVQPDTCVINDVYTDLPENYGKPDKNKPLPQGLIYFELACPQAQISVYYHAISVVRRNFIFQKFGPKVPGDLNTVDWFTLPNVTFEAVQVGEKSVVKATYTITDGGLGDSTGVDGRIVDPGGIMVK